MGKYIAIKLLLASLLFFSMIFYTVSVYVEAATIHGTIYDLALDQESNIKIEINTVPDQFFVSKDGEYSLNVPLGNYTINATTMDGFARENINVTETAGDYVIDIILEPIIIQPVDIDTNFSEPSTELPSDKNPNNIVTKTNNSNLIYESIIIIAIIALIASGMILYARRQKRSSNKDDDKTLGDDKDVDDDKAIDYVKPYAIRNLKADKQGVHENRDDDAYDDEYGKNILDIIRKEGRITQKDLRKQVPLSEGKISLIITDLADTGKIRKIKKGRGNILIFIKD